MIKIILHCSASKLQFIKSDSKNILNGCAKFEKFQTFEFSVILIELMRNDNFTICDNCFELFEGIKNFITIDVTKIDENVWKKFVLELENLYNKKKEKYTKKCGKIIQWIYGLLGQEQLKNILNQIQLSEKFAFFEKCFNENAKKTTSTMSFRDFKKQKFNKKPNFQAPVEVAAKGEVQIPNLNENLMKNEINKMPESGPKLDFKLPPPKMKMQGFSQPVGKSNFEGVFTSLNNNPVSSNSQNTGNVSSGHKTAPEDEDVEMKG